MSFLFRYLRFHDIIGGIHVPVDDGVDKLNRKYTLLVFLFLALPIFTKQYIGDPIECFAPVYFAEHQSRYINSYCWTQSTYYMVPVGDPEDDGDQQEPPDRIMPDEVDYFIGFETVTHIGNERLRRVRVSYYQWAPLILLAQGLCFYIPFLIWNSCANNAGVKLRRLLKKASDIASLPPGCQQREALLAEFVDQFHTLVTGEAGWCADLQCGGGGGLCGSGGGGGAGGGGLNGPPSNASSTSSGNSSGSSANGPGGQQAAAGRSGAGQDRGHRGQQQAGRAGGRGDTDRSDHRHQNNNNNDDINNSTGGCCLLSIPILSCCLKPCAPFGLVGPSKYLCLLYLAVKFAYVFNVGLQFFLLGQFLGRGYLRHGLELINRLIISGEWWASPRFPLSTLCQVRADMSGGLRSYTCQCVLPINVFNEKIFSVVWFYMAFLLPLNVFSLLFWIYRTFETNRISYIRLCLWRTRLVELNQIHRTVRRLSQSYLGWDGVFLLRLIEHNHGSIMATLIMSRLWEFYANQMKLQEDANQLALANNAQHTLSNIAATAISNQHQLMAAAAVAAQQHQQAHHHPQQQQPQQQQQQQLVHAHHGGGGGGAHHGPQAPSSHSHHHGPGGHGHTHGHHHGPPGGGHFHAVLQPTTAAGPAGGQAHFGGGGGTSGPMVPPAPSAAAMLPHTGQHAHHSGQISQPPGHHPLHAANTAHHGHNTSTLSGPHLSGAFTNSSLLAQLQHQQSLHGASQTANSLQQQQQQPAGNVAAAVAALAAATAATNQQQANAASAGPQLNNNNNNSNSNNTTSNSNSTSNGQPAGGAGSGPQAAGKGPANPSAANLHHHHHPTIHLHSLMQTPASGGQPQQQQSAQPQQQQQQQQVAPSSQSATTSFITSASGTGGTASSGPPLPPPPPAHVVAAVAAATANSGGVSAGAPGSARGTGGPPAPGPAPAGAASRPGAPSSNPILFNLKSSSQLVQQQQQQQQQAASGQANPTNQSASTATTGASAGPSGPATGRQFNSPHQTKR